MYVNVSFEIMNSGKIHSYFSAVFSDSAAVVLA